MTDAFTDPSLAYRGALGAYATGVTVITARDDQGAVGLTVNSFASVSLEPRLILWCLGDRSDRRLAFESASRFGVNILGSEDQALSERFAGGAWRIEPNEFSSPPPEPPQLEGALTYLDCATRERIVQGDHLVIVGQVLSFATRAGEGLLYFRGRYGRARVEDELR